MVHNTAHPRFSPPRQSLAPAISPPPLVTQRNPPAPATSPPSFPSQTLCPPSLPVPSSPNLTSFLPPPFPPGGWLTERSDEAEAMPPSPRGDIAEIAPSCACCSTRSEPSSEYPLITPSPPPTQSPPPTHARAWTARLLAEGGGGARSSCEAQAEDEPCGEGPLGWSGEVCLGVRCGSVCGGVMWCRAAWCGVM